MYKKYYSSLAILVIGFFIIKGELILEGSFGIIEDFLFFFRWLLIIGVLSFVTISWALKTVKPKYNYLPLLTVIAIGLLSFLANYSSGYRLNSTDKIVARNFRHYDPRNNTLRLKGNGNYFVELEYLEWLTRYSGKYEIHNDTLHIDKEIISKSDSIFNDLYIYSVDKKYFIPIIKNKLSTDSIKWLKINGEN